MNAINHDSGGQIKMLYMQQRVSPGFAFIFEEKKELGEIKHKLIKPFFCNL